jgi:hypothetical protein
MFNTTPVPVPLRMLQNHATVPQHATYLVIVSHLLVTSSCQQSSCPSLQAQYTLLSSSKLCSLKPAPYMSLYSCCSLVTTDVIYTSADTKENQPLLLISVCLSLQQKIFKTECSLLDVTPRILADKHPSFRGTWCHHLHSQR